MVEIYHRLCLGPFLTIHRSDSFHKERKDYFGISDERYKAMLHFIEKRVEYDEPIDDDEWDS